MSVQDEKKTFKQKFIILLFVLILLIIAAVWMFKPKSADVVSTPVAETTEETVPLPETSVEEPKAEEEVQSDISSSDSATNGDPIKIDTEKAFAPRTLGDANAPIKIIEYSSLTCSHCAHFFVVTFPELKKKYIDTGKVFFEFRDFPLNDPALRAALAARCLPEEQYEAFIEVLFKTQEQWAGGIDYMAALKKNANLAGLSEEEFDACQNQGDLKLRIADEMQVAKDKWKLASTPTFIINDGAEVISGAQSLQEFERIFRKVSNDAIGATSAVQ